MDNPLTKLVTGSLVIFVCENKQPTPRLGIIVSKRNVRKAASRNRIKRHIRESFRLHQDILSGRDIVVIGRKAAEILSSRGQLANILGEQWKKLAAKSF